MKLTTTTTTADIIKTPKFVKFTAFTLLSLSLLLLLFNHFSPSSEISAPTPSLSPPHQNSLPPPPLAPENPVVERMGIVDENGAMGEDFKIGDFDMDSSLVEETQNLSDGGEESGVSVSGRVKIDKFRVCDEKMRDYIPCFDNVEEIKRWNWSERRCPGEGKGLDCLVPMPKGYKRTIPWPQSRDEVWFSNLPHVRPVEVEGGKNLIAIKNDKFIFPSGGTQIIPGENQYLNHISQMVPDIAFGHRTRVALDIGCGVASFGAFLMQLNVTTLSIAPKDVHENQIQFALERGVPAMVAVFAEHRFLYPSQAFDLIHCSRCGINWTRDDGILLLEANRLLRAGGYFVWAYPPVNKHEENVQEQWKDMKDLTTRICWELVNGEGTIAVWRKPLNNSCYLNRDTGVKPPICDSNDDPDKVWYIGLRACITRLPENGYGANVTRWPARLHYPPDRLQSIKLDAYISRKEIFNAESKYWNKIIDSYVGAFHWKEYKLRNVMDMRAGFGGFAAALHDFQIDCWVMNVVPVSGFNTLPIVYDRGLIGVMHDWCEPFDTYPRTYDLLHAAGLFSVEQKRCNISTIMLEMDRMLRPGGRVYIRESVSVISELQELATAMGWTTALHDTSEGPHSSMRILICEKRM